MKNLVRRARHYTLLRWLTKRPHLWRGTGTIGPLSERKLRIFRLMQADGLYSKTTLWGDTNIETLVNYLRRRQPAGVIALARSRSVKQKYGLITVAQWTAMPLSDKSRVIDQMWQIPHACERLSAAWKVVKLLLSWGCTIEWTPPLDEQGRKLGGHYCLVDVEHSKICLESGVGYAPTLSESLCCASLRCVGLLSRT